MTNVFWNDLKLLKDIIDDIQVKDLQVNEKDIDDLKESICYFINDILTNNIHIYSDKHFDELLFEEVLDTINKTYYNAIDLSSFDPWVRIYVVQKGYGVEYGFPTCN